MAFLAARLRKDPIKNARGRTLGRAVSKDWGFTFPSAKALISSSNETTGECQVQVLSRRSSQIRSSALLRFTLATFLLHTASFSLSLLRSSRLLFCFVTFFFPRWWLSFAAGGFSWLARDGHPTPCLRRSWQFSSQVSDSRWTKSSSTSSKPQEVIAVLFCSLGFWQFYEARTLFVVSPGKRKRNVSSFIFIIVIAWG